MKVTKTLSMKEYDNFCKRSLTKKIPDWTSLDFRRRVGDCIYDFSQPGQPRLRPSVHTAANQKKDLSGMHALLSNHFYYFGDKPLQLPEYLVPIIHATQGHKSRSNARYAADFVHWIENTVQLNNAVLGQPQLRKRLTSMTPKKCRTYCSGQDRKDDLRNERPIRIGTH
jgi:hypothetical protein